MIKPPRKRLPQPASWDRRAAAALDTGDYEAATTLYRQWSHRCRVGTADLIRAQHGLASALSLCGDVNEARHVSASALESALALGDDDLELMMLQQFGRLSWIAARCPDAMSTFETYLSKKPNRKSPHYLSAMLEYAHLLSAMGQAERALTILDAAESSEAIASLDATVMLILERAYALTNAASHEEGIAAYRLATSLVRNRHDPQLIAMAINGYAATARNVGRIDIASRLHEEVLLYLDKVLIPWRKQYCLASYALTKYFAGDLKGATALLELSTTAPPSNPQVAIVQQALGLYIAVASGDRALLARSAKDESLIETALLSCEPHRIGLLGGAIHQYLRFVGREEDAAGILERASTAVENPEGCSLLYLEIARYGSASAVKRSLALVQSQDIGPRVPQSLHLLLRSRSLGLAGEAQALHEADLSALLFEELRWPIHRAVALELAGRYGEAAGTYANCGATASARRLRGMRQRVGRPRRTSGQLTTRELEVAKLCVIGLRNHEIAERMGVSVGTIEFHMSNILREMNLTSRHDLRDALS